MIYKQYLSYFLSSTMRAFSRAFIWAAAFCFAASIVGHAQSLPETAEQNIGAVDPLLHEYKFPRQGINDSSKNISANNLSLNQRGNFSAAAGELDASLSVNIDSYPGNVRSTVVQPDGKILIGGYFKSVNGVRHKSIVRLNADTSLDSTFSASVNGTILAIAVQTDGKIIIGGSFNTVGGLSRNRIARLNADGSLDTTFNPGIGADNLVYDVAVQPDGKILLGGNFTSVNSTFNYGIARLNANGSIDASFVSPILPPAPSSPVQSSQIPSIVYSLGVQADGKIVIGGFIVLSYATPATVFTPVARLNANGSFDTTFNAGTFNSNASKIVLQPDGKILVAGFFTLINNVRQNFITRLNANGSLDTSFDAGTGANFPVNSIFLKPDGKILLVGRFSTINGVARSGLAQLNADGSLDAAFVPTGGSFGTAQSVVSLPNGKIFLGGSFNQGLNFGSSDSVKIYNPDGSADTSFRFETTALGGVRAIAVQPDGKIIVGGNFTRPRSASIPQLFRLNVNGSLDETFAPASSTTFSSSTSGQINSIVLQPDGKILVAGTNIIISSGGGSFLGGNLVRLNADGTPDGSFAAGNIPTGSGLNAVALQPDGKIIAVWGDNRNNIPTGGIARLNGDGSLDNSFNISARALWFDSVVIQPDGKILAAGPFSFGYVNSQTGSVFYNGLIRLNADGSHDTDFVPATTSSYENNRVTELFALSLQTDGKILIGGSIFTGGATTPTGTARLNPDGTLDTTFNSGGISSVAAAARVEDILLLPSGKVLIGGLFNSIGASQRNNVARLNADGSLDDSFNSGTDNAVYKIAAQTDGKVLIGGDFEFVNGVARTSLARLLSEPLAASRARFDFDGDGKSDLSVFRPSNGVWYLQQSAAGFTGIAFGQNGDKLTPADYDGDGKTDVAVFRGGTWYLQRSQAGFTGVNFGNADDTPQPADFDGDGKAELAVYRPSNGTWYVYNLATNQVNAVQFGAGEDKPVAADYDGDGKTDYAVFRPSNGVWYLLRSSLGFTGIAFGQTGDNPVAGDYDGDGKSDVAVFRPSNGTWYLLQSSAGFAGITFGLGTDQPTPADFDGDGKTDVAVFRPSNGTWYLQRTSQGFTGIQFGASNDIAVPNAFVP